VCSARARPTNARTYAHEPAEELAAAAPRQPTSILRRCRPGGEEYRYPARNEPLRRGRSPGGAAMKFDLLALKRILGNCWWFTPITHAVDTE